MILSVKMFKGLGGFGYYLRTWVFFSFFKKDFTYLFLERREGREKERERNINVWLPLICSLLRTWPATQACALTGNRTSDPSDRRPGSSHEPQQPVQDSGCSLGDSPSDLSFYLSVAPSIPSMLISTLLTCVSRN